MFTCMLSVKGENGSWKTVIWTSQEEEQLQPQQIQQEEPFFFPI